MNKKTLTKIVLCALGMFALPVITFAANDVTLTTSAVISVGGYSLNVTGSSAVVNSITVNASNFTVTLSSGSSITVTSPTRNLLTTDLTSNITTSSCSDSLSSISLGYSGSGTVTNTITPSSTICQTVGAAPSNPTTAFAPGGGTANNAPIKSLPTSPGVSPSGFSRDLGVGSSSSDVKNLQVYLNTHGYVISTKGVGSKGKETNSFGAMTKQALIKFQKANGILPATGYFGPLTRKYVQTHQ